MRVNYFLLISSEDKVAAEITERFFSSYVVEEVIEKFRTTETTTITLGEFRVDFLAFEVEDSFISMLQDLGWFTGLVWLQNAATNLLMWEDLQPVLLPRWSTKNTSGEPTVPNESSVVNLIRLEDGVITVYVDTDEEQSPLDTDEIS